MVLILGEGKVAALGPRFDGSRLSQTSVEAHGAPFRNGCSLYRVVCRLHSKLILGRVAGRGVENFLAAWHSRRFGAYTFS